MDALRFLLCGNRLENLVAKAFYDALTSDLGLNDIDISQQSSGYWSVSQGPIFLLKQVLNRCFATDAVSLINVTANFCINMPGLIGIGVSEAQFSHADVASHAFGIEVLPTGTVETNARAKTDTFIRVEFHLRTLFVSMLSSGK